ncbi:unnamed protein product [Haemonchus placei]|uniref:Coiled-coil domain-containing protein 86 n=1 Tax=Haemonchus placei TaxID=6290 RepID=A0A0N4WQU3_HAEPC|nr:unnamed protein product [Haemonchus placei]
MEVDDSEVLSDKEESKTTAEIKGLPKSGRWWKNTRNARSASASYECETLRGYGFNISNVFRIANVHICWRMLRPIRHSAVVKVKPLKSSWEKKMADKAKLKQAKLLQQEIRDRQLQEKQEKIERKKEQEKRRLENERKGEVVQVIRNTAKLRKAKKKQLRMIVKRDTN